MVDAYVKQLKEQVSRVKEEKVQNWFLLLAKEIEDYPNPEKVEHLKKNLLLNKSNRIFYRYITEKEQESLPALFPDLYKHIKTNPYSYFIKKKDSAFYRCEVSLETSFDELYIAVKYEPHVNIVEYNGSLKAPFFCILL